MNNLIIIPARKNSIRLKNKNLLKINNLTLIEHTIRFAKKISKVSNILVSTDSSKIRAISLKNKVLSPWFRPKKLAKSNTPTESVILHALNWYEKNYKKVDFIVLLQPTSPFRKKSTFKNCLSIAKKNYDSTVITFKKIKQTNFNLKKSNLKLSTKESIVPNGNLFLISSKKIKKNKKLYSGKIKAYFISNIKENIDIDTKNDFILAKKIMRRF